MAKRAFLQSTKNKDVRFEILKFDPETKTATVQGKHGTFTMSPFTKAKVTADGYELVTEEVQ